MTENVPNIEHFKQFHKEVVQQIVQCRKSAGLTQNSLAEWLGVDRRNIIDLEAGKKIPFSLILLCADKFSIDIKLNYDQH